MEMTEYEKMRAALLPVLKQWGFTQSAEKIQSDDLNYSYSTYVAEKLEYRILWNSEEACGYIQHCKNNEWVSLKPSAAQGNEFGSSLTKMRKALTEHVALAKLKTWPFTPSGMA